LYGAFDMCYVTFPQCTKFMMPNLCKSTTIRAIQEVVLKRPNFLAYSVDAMSLAAPCSHGMRGHYAGDMGEGRRGEIAIDR
jgi:hypothetical protein